jgi:hypothetical protein
MFSSKWVKQGRRLITGRPRLNEWVLPVRQGVGDMGPESAFSSLQYGDLAGLKPAFGVKLHVSPAHPALHSAGRHFSGVVHVHR